MIRIIIISESFRVNGPRTTVLPWHVPRSDVPFQVNPVPRSVCSEGIDAMPPKKAKGVIKPKAKAKGKAKAKAKKVDKVGGDSKHGEREVQAKLAEGKPVPGLKPCSSNVAISAPRRWSTCKGPGENLGGLASQQV